MEWYEYYPEEYNFLPCRIDYNNGDKILRFPFKEWKSYQEKRFPRDLLETYDKFPARVVICGNQAERDYTLIVLDIDKNNGVASKELYNNIIAKEPRLKEALTIQTQSGSYHFHVQVESLECYTSLKKNKDLPATIEGIKNIDIQGKGKLAITYPTLNYEILNESQPLQLTNEEFLNVVHTITTQPKEKPEEPEVSLNRMRKGFQDICFGTIDIEKKASETSISKFLYWKFTFLEARFREKLQFEDTATFLQQHQPSYDHEETMRQLQTIKGLTPATSKKYYELFPEYKKDEKEESINYYDIVELILAKEDIEAINLKKGRVDYCYYKNGYYTRGQQNYIEKIIADTLELLGQPYSVNKNTALLKLIKAKTLIELEEFDKESYINLQNGLLDIHTFELKPHTPEYLSLRQIPINYDPFAKCPKISKFIAGVVAKRHITHLYQKIGLSLTPFMQYQKCTFFYGSGNNGKTTLFNLLRAFLGIENCSNIRMVQSGFVFSTIEGKLANFCSDEDVSKKREFPIQFVKIWVGNELIVTINRKFIPPYDIKPTGKLWFSSNETFPNVPPETDKGFWRKVDIIECPYVYDREEDSGLLEELTTEEELSGLFNIALVGLKLLLKRGRFHYKYYHWDKTKDLWLTKLDDFQDFIDSKAEIKGSQYYTVKSVVQQHYNKWLRAKGKPPISANKLTRIINSIPEFYYNPDKKKMVNGKRQRVYFGFQFNVNPIQQIRIDDKGINEE